MSNIILTNEQNKTLADKRSAWANLGAAIYKLDLELQASAQQLIGKLIYPTDIKQVEEAEKALKEVKSERIKLENRRKEITNPVNERMSELMASEKSLTDPIAKAESAIISIKKAEQERIDSEKKRQNQIIQLTEFCKLTFEKAKNEHVLYINDVCTKSYLNALNKGILPENVLSMIDDFINSFQKEKFYTPVINVFNYDKIKVEEAEEIVNRYKTIVNADELYKLLCDEIRKKFSDYEVAFLNKEEAAKKANEEDAAKKAEVENQNKMAEIASKISASAEHQQPVVTNNVKALKSVYKVDMPETVESVLLIMAAFSGNIDKCLPKLKVNKWFAFTPLQAATCLEKIKNDDENFNPQGIIFKSHDKL